MMKKKISYINILDHFIHNYNNKYHRSIRCTPEEASKPENSNRIRKILYSTGQTKRKQAKAHFKLGDFVRIQLEKPIFRKSYTQNYSEEIFEIYEIIRNSNDPIAYRLIDLVQDEVLKGVFYEPELQRVCKSNKDLPYRFEKVLKQRGTRNSLQLLVKFRGLKHPKWMSKNDVRNIRGR